MQFFAKFRDLLAFREDVSCLSGCPVNTDSGMYVRLIAQGKFEDAYLTARAPNPFASSCGRVCAAPCEDNCRRGAVDEPVSIRSLKKFLTERFGVESEKPDTYKKLFTGIKPPSHIHNLQVANLVETKAEKNGMKIAVIGAGPAGLSVAHDLAILGYGVTVFELFEKAGGMMRYGIPSYRLPDDVLDKEVRAIEDLGVEIRLNTRIDQSNGGIARLKNEGYNAIFLGHGVIKGRHLNMEGSDLDGVHTALEFLVNSNKGITTETGNRSVIIGGGLVAMDAARDVRRQLLNKDPSATYDVHLAYLEDWQSMPAALSESGRQEIEETMDEDIHFHPSWGPHRIVGENGRVTGIELKKVLRVFDEEGRFSPQFDESQIKTIPCDSVIFAIGQMADLSYLAEQDGVGENRGIIRIDENLMTTAPGVYAGGDAAFGPKNLIDAVANGKRAAIAIDEYLTKQKRNTIYDVRIEQYYTPRYGMMEDYDRFERKTPNVAEPEKRVGVQEIELSFDEDEAVKQASRCLTCHTSPVYNGDLCIICGRCVDICPQDCLSFSPISEVVVDGVEDNNHWATDKLGLSAADEITVMLKDDEACIRCGLCATRCPTDALTMESIIVEEHPAVA